MKKEMPYTLKRWPRFGYDLAAESYPYFQGQYDNGEESWTWTWRYASKFASMESAVEAAKALDDRYIYAPVQWGL